MKHLLILAAIAALAVPSTVAAGNGVAKPPKPAKPAKVAKPGKAAPAPPVIAAEAQASVFATLTATTLSITGTGLTPGDRYSFTFQVYGIHDAYPISIGGSSGLVVRDDGTTTASIDLGELLEWRSPLSKVVMWLRPYGSHASDVSVNDAGDRLIVTQTF